MRFLLAFLLFSCARSHGLDGSDLPDAGAPDADEGLSCGPEELIGCSFVERRWFWDGADCYAADECVGRGADTRAACLHAHRHCDRDIDPCAPMDAADQAPCAVEFSQAAWDGERCVEVSHCSCEGVDCDDAFVSMAECARAYEACGAEVCEDGDVLRPEGVCLYNNLLHSDRPSELHFVHACGEGECDVEIDRGRIEITICGRESGACAVPGRSIACSIPPVREGIWTVSVNGEEFEMRSEGPRIAFPDPGCFCNPVGEVPPRGQDLDSFLADRSLDALRSDSASIQRCQEPFE
ncbi:MAG: hypothetical protein AAGE52_23150 [Myxococcota bacterium]